MIKKKLSRENIANKKRKRRLNIWYSVFIKKRRVSLRHRDQKRQKLNFLRGFLPRYLTLQQISSIDLQARIEGIFTSPPLFMQSLILVHQVPSEHPPSASFSRPLLWNLDCHNQQSTHYTTLQEMGYHQ